MWLLAWLDTWFDISNTYGSVWSNGVGQNRETDKEDDKYCVEEGFQLARVKSERWRGRQWSSVSGILVPIFEMDQCRNKLGSRKAVYTLKTISQYFYYLVFRIPQFLRCAIFYIE